MELTKNLEKLCGIPGVSGMEGPVREEILSQLGGDCQSSVDALGNLIVFKKGAKTPKNKLLFAAHMDEVGFIVTYIEDSGLLRFATVGGIDGRVIIGKGVEVGPNRLYGVIGSKAVHMQKESEREKAPKPEELFIDIGAASREEAEQAVRPGDRAVFYSPFCRVGNNKLMGRALDDRVGCALMLWMLAHDLPYDCHFAFTVQEETGCTGAKTAGYAVDADIAVVVEGTTASDIAGTDSHKVVCSQGKGAVLSFMDRGTVYDRELYQLALTVAEQAAIPVQSKLGVYGGNDSRSLQVAADGARTLAVSLPLRYIHSPSNLLDERDLTNTAALLEKLLPTLAEA